MLLAGVAFSGQGCFGCDDSANASVVVAVSSADGGNLQGLTVEYSVDGGGFDDCEAMGDTGGVSQSSFLCGWEEAGDIEVRATANGYSAASDVVKVKSGRCHVNGEQVDLVLQPS